MRAQEPKSCVSAVVRRAASGAGRLREGEMRANTPSRQPPQRSAGRRAQWQGHGLDTVVYFSVAGSSGFSSPACLPPLPRRRRRTEQSTLLERTAGAPLLAEGSDEILHRRLRRKVLALQVDVELARARVAKGRRSSPPSGTIPAIRTGLHLVGILFEIAEAEDAKRARFAANLLNEKIVVLPRFNIDAVLSDLGADVLVLRLVRLLQMPPSPDRCCSPFRIKVGKAVTGTRCRRRSENTDLDGRKRRIDVLPGLRRVRALAERIGGERLVDIGCGQVERGCRPCPR